MPTFCSRAQQTGITVPKAAERNMGGKSNIVNEYGQMQSLQALIDACIEWLLQCAQDTGHWLS